jgi:hypothetical protein
MKGRAKVGRGQRGLTFVQMQCGNAATPCGVANRRVLESIAISVPAPFSYWCTLPSIGRNRDCEAFENPAIS